MVQKQNSEKLFNAARRKKKSRIHTIQASYVAEALVLVVFWVLLLAVAVVVGAWVSRLAMACVVMGCCLASDPQLVVVAPAP